MNKLPISLLPAQNYLLERREKSGRLDTGLVLTIERLFERKTGIAD